MQGLASLAAEYGVPLHLQGLPMAFHASLGSAEPFGDLRGLLARDATRYARFAQRLVDHGVWVAPRGIWYVSAAHGERELRLALERAAAALKQEAG
jgi:glutamate-1-semialdehyde 2,1-aminomutase